MRRAWARAAENPRLLTELADEAARKSQVLGRRFALDRSRHRKFQQIMAEVRPLLEAARKHGQEWACLRAEAEHLEGITSQIGRLHAQIEANGGDGRHQQLEQMVELSEQARALGRRVTSAARDLALQKKRIRRKVAHVEEHFLLLNPAYVRSQLDYVADQVAFAQEMSDVELAREELRRTLNLIDDIVVHGGGGQDGKTGY
jgi:hypothetical protein